MHKSNAVCGGKRWQEISIFHTSSSQQLSSRNCKLRAAAAMHIFVSMCLYASQFLSLCLQIFQDFSGKISLRVCVVVQLTWKFHLTYSSGNNFIYIYICIYICFCCYATAYHLQHCCWLHILMVVFVFVCITCCMYEWVIVAAVFVCLAVASLRLPNCQRNLFMPNQMWKSIFSYLMSRKFI